LHKQVFKTLILIAIFGLVLSWSGPIFALGFNYRRFFEQEKNFYLAHPQIIETIFLGLVDLKGDPEVARRHIRSEVLGCPVGQQLASNCQLDRLKEEKKNRSVPDVFGLAINFTEVVLIPQPGKYDRLKLSWRQETFEAPVIEVEEFLTMIGAAKESPYYQIKEGVKQLVFNAQFGNHFEIVELDRLAKDMAHFYENPPQDNRDRIYYQAAEANLTIEENLASLNLFMKAVKVKINHRYIKVENDPKRPVGQSGPKTKR